MTQSPEEKEILDLFAQGGHHSEKAFKLLVKQYSESLYHLIRRYTKNHEHTNDVLQNVLIKVFKNLADFKQDSALYTWLYRIARNESLNFIEKEKRKTGVDIDEPILEIIAGNQAIDNLGAEKISDLLHKAISTLPEKQALVFQLKYFEDLKYSEISSRLNTSEGALKASFHHARQKIEDFLIKELNHLPI